MSKPTLAELQRWFHWAATRPDPESREGEPSPSCETLVADAPPLARAARLEIYRNAYFSRLAEALEQDFAITRWALGEGAFRGLVMRYLECHPSSFTNIGEVGNRLPAFLGEDEQGNELPFLSDLARFEWLLIEAFHAESLPLLDPMALARLPEDRWPGARLRLDASLRFFESQWPILELRARHEAASSDEASPDELDFEKSPGTALVFRHPAHGVDVQAATPEQLRLARLLTDGRTLGEAIDAFEDPSWIPATLSEWTRAGVIRTIEGGGDSS